MGSELLHRTVEAAVLVFKFLHARHARRIDAAEPGAPLLEGDSADAVGATELGDGYPRIRFQHGDDLAVGNPGSLDGSLVGSVYEKIQLLTTILSAGLPSEQKRNQDPTAERGKSEAQEASHECNQSAMTADDTSRPHERWTRMAWEGSTYIGL